MKAQAGFAPGILRSMFSTAALHVRWAYSHIARTRSSLVSHGVSLVLSSFVGENPQQDCDRLSTCLEGSGFFASMYHSFIRR